ncbi:hypothetical protein M885DRAFT_614606 [Pelagophyceae sp. CCMP2097]|nr:hypothetical protein M885DRAFT_614606 [Pelagophyceae sp. CCMP2097]
MLEPLEQSPLRAASLSPTPPLLRASSVLARIERIAFELKGVSFDGTPLDRRRAVHKLRAAAAAAPLPDVWRLRRSPLDARCFRALLQRHVAPVVLSPKELGALFDLIAVTAPSPSPEDAERTVDSGDFAIFYAELGAIERGRKGLLRQRNAKGLSPVAKGSLATLATVAKGQLSVAKGDAALAKGSLRLSSTSLRRVTAHRVSPFPAGPGRLARNSLAPPPSVSQVSRASVAAAQRRQRALKAQRRKYFGDSVYTDWSPDECGAGAEQRIFLRIALIKLCAAACACDKLGSKEDGLHALAGDVDALSFAQLLQELLHVHLDELEVGAIHAGYCSRARFECVDGSSLRAALVVLASEGVRSALEDVAQRPRQLQAARLYGRMNARQRLKSAGLAAYLKCDDDSLNDLGVVDDDDESTNSSVYDDDDEVGDRELSTLMGQLRDHVEAKLLAATSARVPRASSGNIYEIAVVDKMHDVSLAARHRHLRLELDAHVQSVSLAIMKQWWELDLRPALDPAMRARKALSALQQAHASASVPKILHAFHKVFSAHHEELAALSEALAGQRTCAALKSWRQDRRRGSLENESDAANRLQRFIAPRTRRASVQRLVAAQRVAAAAVLVRCLRRYAMRVVRLRVAHAAAVCLQKKWSTYQFRQKGRRLGEVRLYAAARVLQALYSRSRARRLLGQLRAARSKRGQRQANRPMQHRKWRLLAAASLLLDRKRRRCAVKKRAVVTIQTNHRMIRTRMFWLQNVGLHRASTRLAAFVRGYLAACLSPTCLPRTHILRLLSLAGRPALLAVAVDRASNLAKADLKLNQNAPLVFVSAYRPPQPPAEEGDGGTTPRPKTPASRPMTPASRPQTPGKSLEGRRTSVDVVVAAVCSSPRQVDVSCTPQVFRGEDFATEWGCTVQLAVDGSGGAVAITIADPSATGSAVADFLGQARLDVSRPTPWPAPAPKPARGKAENRPPRGYRRKGSSAYLPHAFTRGRLRLSLDAAVHHVDVGRGRPLHLKNCGRTPHGHVSVVVAQVSPATCMCGHLDILEDRILTSPSWAPRWAVLVDGRLTLLRARGDAEARQQLEMAHVTDIDVDADGGTFTLSTAGAQPVVLRVATDVAHGRTLFRMWLRRLRRTATRIPTNEFISEELDAADYAVACLAADEKRPPAATPRIPKSGQTPRGQTPRGQLSPAHGSHRGRRDSES